MAEELEMRTPEKAPMNFSVEEAKLCLAQISQLLSF
jgi:hypothetical protein